MNPIFAQAFAWLKGLAIVNLGLKALKQLWPLLIIFIFWPEIDDMMSGLFPFWNQYMSSVSGVICNGAYYLRQIPFIEPIFSWGERFLSAVGQRLQMIF